jgi:hypothetical protein
MSVYNTIDTISSLALDTISVTLTNGKSFDKMDCPSEPIDVDAQVVMFWETDTDLMIVPLSQVSDIVFHYIDVIAQ